MSAAASSPTLRSLSEMLGWRRLRVMLGACLVVSLLILPTWAAPYAVLLARLLIAGLLVLLTFGLFERWPARLPSWLARWALQVVAVALSVPLGVWAAYTLTTMGDQPPWWETDARLIGFSMMTVFGVLLAPWLAISALLRQISGEAQRQALTFELERSKLEREAVNARLSLLQAQVRPHFLFNTLANVRELVDSGSPQASAVLDSLIAYLRAAVPRLRDPAISLKQEFELVRAYLEVMHMRMPDRLTFVMHADEETCSIECPPMTVLTLVENAVRHGIDPSEEGGRIEVRGQVSDGRCRVQVIDSGVGLGPGVDGPGTGLSNLRERLRLAFGDDARLRLTAHEPHGVCAEVEFPARGSAA